MDGDVADAAADTGTENKKRNKDKNKQTLAPSKILVVDDEPDLEHLVRQRMRREIRSGAYIFIFARNGIEALELLTQDASIDMVLSDINMPQMDGLTLLEQIPQVNPNVRSVIVSAYGDMRNIRTAMNRGAFDFITKPIDFEDMRVTISRTLENLAVWREALSSRDKLVSLQQELTVASSIQRSILPNKFPEHPGWEMTGDMYPARDVGGDFFYVSDIADDQIHIAIADVSDKGVAAALFMMSCQTLLEMVSRDSPDSPGAVLRKVNEQLNRGNDSMMFVTVLYGTYNVKTGKFRYANGGHNLPIIIHPDGSSQSFPATKGMALGIVPELEFEESFVTLNVGDMAVLYTDGVTEAENAEDELFGMEGLTGVFAAKGCASTKEANEKVLSAVKAFADGHPQSDDITCVTFLRKE